MKILMILLRVFLGISVFDGIMVTIAVINANKVQKEQEKRGY